LPEGEDVGDLLRIVADKLSIKPVLIENAADNAALKLRAQPCIHAGRARI
jgi:hypothetical protein